jgi:hypothetical protein
MNIRQGHRDITVYIGFRPFEGEWIERNQTVLNALAWQDVSHLKVKFVCWPEEVATARYATEHGYECVVIPWARHYLFTGPQRSFKLMFETALMDCDTEIFVYINGDIVLGPGILNWLQQNMELETLYSLPRHNWEFTKSLSRSEDFAQALDVAVPEEWTALDLFAMRATDARKHLIPLPPFLLTAGSMDSWLVVKAGHLGWSRVLIPPDEFKMLHIEHPYSHPLKPGAPADKLAKWAFNCGVYAAATLGIEYGILADTSLACFTGAKRYKFKYSLPANTYQTPDECASKNGLHKKSSLDKMTENTIADSE